MSCEDLRAEYVNALNQWVKVEERLKEIALPHVGQPPHRAKPIIAGSDEWNEWGELLVERDQLWNDYRASENTYRAAFGRHRG